MLHRALASLLPLAVLAACSGTGGPNVEDKRAFVRQMRDRTLADLYAAHPGFRTRLESAPGYAVFSNVNIHLLALSAGDGYGVAVDRETGKETFMRMAAPGAGAGIATRDFRTVFVFHGDDAVERFAESGSLAAAFVVAGQGVEIYQLTQAGAALDAVMRDSRYVRDSELN